MALMDSRRSLIANVCVKAKNQYSNRDETMYLFFPLRNETFIWCAVPKAASTLMFRNYIILSGKLPDNGDMTMNTAVLNRDIILNGSSLFDVVKNTFIQKDKIALLIVRHPFERLVSGFRNKLEKLNNWQFNSFGRQLVKKYRKKASETFEESYFNSPFPIEPGINRNQDQPIFWEFVQYLTEENPSKFDAHWRPTSISCWVCIPGIQYNYVLKHEMLTEEMTGLFTHLGWNDRGLTTGVIYKGRNGNWTSKAVTDVYFKDISDKDIVSLYKVFKHDFLFFNYTFERGNLKLPLDEDK